MPSNISIAITADVVDLQAKFAVARSESAALTQELNKLAKTAATSGMTDQLQADLNKAAEAALLAKSRAADLGAELKESLAPATAEAAEGMGIMGAAAGFLESTLAPLAAALAPIAIFEFAKGIEESSAEIYHEAEVLQLSTTALQDFQESAKLAGVDVATTDTAIRKFVDNLGKAEQGTGAQAQAFAQLGISAKQSTEDALPQVAQALLDIQDAGERARLEVALFGRSGEELNPALEQWARGTDELTTSLTALGLILDPATTKAAHDADISLETAWDHLKIATAGPIAGATEGVARLITQLSSLKGIADAAVLSVGGIPVDAPSAKASAGPQIAHPKYNPEEIQEQGEVSALGAINPKLLERKKLTEDLATAQKTFNDAKKWDDQDGMADATTTLAVLKKKQDALNKPESDPAAAAAKRESEQIIATNKQTNDAIIAGKQQLNASEFALGQESLAQFTQQELANAKEKYAADLAALQQQEAVGKLTHAEYLASKALLDQQYSNETAQIGEQSAQKQRSLDDKAFADFEKAQEEKVKAAQDANDRQYKIGQLTAAEMDALDLASVQASKAAVDQQFALLTAGWDQESAAYKTELERRLEFDKWYEEQKHAIEARTAQADVAQWRETVQQIESAEDSLISNIFSGRMTLTQMLGQMGLQFLQQEIKNDLLMLTERQLVNAKMLSSDQATAQGGLLAQLAASLFEKETVVSTEAAKTGAAAAGMTARTTITATGAATSVAIEKAAGATTISSDAAKAAAGAYQSASQIPYVGWILGPAAAAAAFIAVEAFGASAEGGQYSVPSAQQLTMLHFEEQVLPRGYARGLSNLIEGRESGRSSGQSSGGGGGDFSPRYNIQALDSRGFERVIRANMGHLARVAKNYQRNQGRS